MAPNLCSINFLLKSLIFTESKFCNNKFVISQQSVKIKTGTYISHDDITATSGMLLNKYRA